MNILLFSSEHYGDDRIISVPKAQAEHILKVQKFKQGDSLRVGEINGLVGQGQLINEDIEHLQISCTLTQSPPEKKNVSVFLALPRPPMLKRMLTELAMIGVEAVHIFNSHYVQKSYWQSPALKPDALQGYLLKGLEQSCDSVLPTISLHPKFHDFINTEFSELAYPDVYLGDPRAEQSCPQPAATPCSIIIGPENGFTEDEIQLFEQRGVHSVTLGQRHLRAETAMTYILGKILP